MSATIRGDGFAARLALFYGALFVVYGMHVPYFPVWLDWRGLTASEISAIMAAPFFLRLVITPTAALWADRTGAHRKLIIALAWTSMALVLALAGATTFLAILALSVPLIICNATLMPLTETIAVAGMRQRGLAYGRVRLWGSLTFVAASFAGGFAVDRFGGGAGIWLVAIGVALVVIVSHLMPRASAQEKAARATPPTALWQAAEPRALIANPTFLTFLLAAGCVQAAHATFLTFGTLIWQSQGLSGGWAGTLWAIGVFAEVGLFAVSGRVADHFGAANLLVIGALASILRWTAMAFDPPLEAMIVLQLLHGVTYGAAHIGAIHFIHDAIPESCSGSAQALYATVASGVAMGVATLIAGSIYASHGSASYMAMAVIAGLSLLAGLHLRRTWRGGPLEL